ncbi:EscU/YscU/HrcU family type III secretion system export apparatus switch protein [Bacillus sp. FJAT-49736]|uniref:EscU/YscU/HrcU family type III secretion system export apparatus switch protein n=1 Tax=Bacillus sp. FJAT-49736 TaxID=2833582 RepID=UPI001BC8F0B7|nr:EscU/YscU/HrcU family type III secretion system export apparatus switch protein [Bacillus sp. FJAT-49736]MBS4172502.1 EscU/YscU/HrcU family type III secretion system export apparatus switch protein [Bacillus sp. FJAT-49736]
MKNKDELKDRKEAIALSYQSEKNTAPIITAKGKGYVADNIIDKAKENGIPIQEDPNLIQLLGNLDINQMIPEELYEAVAEVFAFIYKVDQRMGEGH